jgi:hypothetical protein
MAQVARSAVNASGAGGRAWIRWHGRKRRRMAGWFERRLCASPRWGLSAPAPAAAHSRRSTAEMGCFPSRPRSPTSVSRAAAAGPAAAAAEVRSSSCGHRCTPASERADQCRGDRAPQAHHPARSGQTRDAARQAGRQRRRSGPCGCDRSQPAAFELGLRDVQPEHHDQVPQEQGTLRRAARPSAAQRQPGTGSQPGRSYRWPGAPAESR